VAINDALPLKPPPRRHAIAKLKSVWGFESELQTNPMPFHLHSLWGATLMPLRVCEMDWRILRVGKDSSLATLSRLWTKVHEILALCRGHLCFDCLCRVSFRRYSPLVLSLEVVEKPNKCKSFFWPRIFLGDMTQIFLRHIVSAIYCPRFGKVWLTVVCWSLSTKPGNEVEYRTCGWWING